MIIASGAAGCSGDLPGRYYAGQGGGLDGAMCVGHGRGYSCGCVDEPYVIGVSVALASNSGLTDLDIDFFRQARWEASQSAHPPAKGSPGAVGFFVASLVSSDGVALSTLVFENPRLALGDAAYAHRAEVEFAMLFPPGSATLHIENWDTGQVLIDLDLRGHLQLLCIDRPCLSICAASGGNVDASGGPTVDAGARDYASALDGVAAEAATSAGTSFDAGAPASGDN